MSDLATDGLELHRNTQSPPTRFVVIGERCSGTNFAAHCLNTNFPLRAATWEVYGWKHGFPTALAYPDDTLHVVMLRDAVSWTKSMYIRPWHARFRLLNKDFSAFIRTRWDSRVQPAKAFNLPDDSPLKSKVLQWDRHPLTGLPYDNILRLRNDKMAGFLSMKQRAANVAFLHMRTLTENAEHAMGRVAEAFSLTPLDIEFELSHRQMGNMKRPVPLIAPAPDELDTKDIEFFSSELDLKQEARMGFDP